MSLEQVFFHQKKSLEQIYTITFYFVNNHCLISLDTFSNQNTVKSRINHAVLIKSDFLYCETASHGSKLLTQFSFHACINTCPKFWVNYFTIKKLVGLDTQKKHGHIVFVQFDDGITLIMLEIHLIFLLFEKIPLICPAEWAKCSPCSNLAKVDPFRRTHAK